MLAGNAFRHSHAFFFGLVREHGATHHVTHSPHAWHVGSALLVYHDGAALV